MSSKRLGIIWKAEPHTIAKITLLQAYLKAWLSILGMAKRSQQLLYIDGFAGPGEYTNYATGSPVAAIEAANSVLGSHHERWLAGDIHCAFIESEKPQFEHLMAKLASVRCSLPLKTHLYNMTFVEGMRNVEREIPQPFKEGHPVFAFIDPFGATGAPFREILNILQQPCGEVLVNLDADGIDRLYQAGPKANADEHLTEIFGDDSWREAMSPVGTLPQRCQRVLDLYKAQLRRIDGVKYVFSFAMLSRDSRLNYYLVFASRNPLGLEKMKEAMRAVDKTGEYQFSDADVGQMKMFQKDEELEARQFAQKMAGVFKGKTAAYQDLADFALNETRYLNPSRMLRYLQENGFLEEVVEVPGSTRRKNEFNADTVTAVVFAKERVRRGLFDD